MLANSAISSDEALVSKRRSQQCLVVAGCDGALTAASPDTCLCWRRWCSACLWGDSTSQKCSTLSLQPGVSQGKEKRHEKKASGCERYKNELSETSWSGLVSLKALLQELHLARMYHTSVWEGSAPRTGGTQCVRGMLQSQTSHLCGAL